LLVTEIEQVDSTWVGGPINYWVSIEANLLIICASLPTVRQFLRAVAPGLVSRIEESDFSKRSGIVTIGGSGASKKNSRRRGLNDSDIMMETLVDGGAGNTSHVHEIEEGNVPGSVDGESNRAASLGGIMKTQTAQVTYTADRLDAIDTNR
jgi:hypothetical protein